MRQRVAVLALAALGWLVGLGSTTLAAEPTPGEQVEVVCKADPEQRYSCYVPKAYDAEKTWPILYCFSPNANGDSFVDRYKTVCEERGWIVVGSMNSKNGPWEPIKAAIDAMWKDTEARFSMSDGMRYVSGFSGGSRVSFAVSKSHAPKIAGVIGIGAGLDDRVMPRAGLAVYLMCGEGDPNKAELDPLAPRLESAGNPVRYENFPGGHVMPPVELMTKAVRWMDDIAVERRRDRFTAAVAEARAALEGGETLEAFVALDAALVEYPAVKEGRKDAEKLLKTLARDPAVKPEIRARKAYDTAAAWLEKNRERVEKHATARAQAVKRFEAIVTKFADTPTAARAQEAISKLQGTSE